MINFLDHHQNPIADLNTLIRELGAGNEVFINDRKTEELIRLQWESQNGLYRKQVIVEGNYAHDLKQVLSYVDGNDRERAELKWFDGVRFHNWF